MNQAKRKWDLLPKEKRRFCIEKIITFFKQSRDEEIGIIAAEEILDFFLEDIGPVIYNEGINDSKELLRKQLDDLEVNIDLLLRK